MTKAKHDRLLVALIAKLPTEMAQWPRVDRVAWLQMMAMAFDVVYGPCGAIRVAADDIFVSAAQWGRGAARTEANDGSRRVGVAFA